MLRRRLLGSLVASTLLVTASSVMADIATNYTAIHSPPNEYVCDNDPLQWPCRAHDKYGNLDPMATSTHTWPATGGDYRWATTAPTETKAHRWEFTPGSQTGLGENRQIWANFPHQVNGNATAVPYYYKPCAYTGGGSSCPTTSLGNFNQSLNQGLWIQIENAVWIDYTVPFTVSASNESPGATGKKVIFDAIDFWDGE